MIQYILPIAAVLSIFGLIVAAFLEVYKSGKHIGRTEAAREYEKEMEELKEFRDSTKYLLDSTQGAIRVRPGGGEEVLVDSLSVNYIHMRDHLRLRNNTQ